MRKGVKQDIKSHVCWHVYGLATENLPLAAMRHRRFRRAGQCAEAMATASADARGSR